MIVWLGRTWNNKMYTLYSAHLRPVSPSQPKSDSFWIENNKIIIFIVTRHLRNVSLYVYSPFNPGSCWTWWNGTLASSPPGPTSSWALRSTTSLLALKYFRLFTLCSIQSYTGRVVNSFYKWSKKTMEKTFEKNDRKNDRFFVSFFFF